MIERLKVIVIDGHEDSCKSLKYFIETHYSNFKYAGDAGSIEDAYTLIKEVSPQIAFMDLSLDGGTGAELISRLLSENKLNFELIFITDNDPGSISDLINFTALDYIKKPIENDEAKSKLQNAVSRAVLNVDKRIFREQIRLMVDLFSKKSASNTNKRIALNLIRGFIQFVNINDMVLLKTDDNITRISINDGRILSSVNNLAFYSKILSQEMGFIRINQSTMVNTIYIDKFNPSEKIVLLTNGESIECSRRGAKVFRDYLDNHENRNSMEEEGGFQELLDKFTGLFK